MKNILLTGGGSGGPTAPLIALYEAMKENDRYAFYWIGTKNGPEKQMLADYPEIHFTPFPAAKLRRYFSLKTLKEPLVFLAAFLKAIIYIYLNKPSVIISVGAYVSVPVVIAGWLMRVPGLIHQQDIQPTLSNKLMAPFARKVTVTFEEQVDDFLGNKVVVTSNPVRKAFVEAHNLAPETLKSKFNLAAGLPVVLIVGGGQGSKQINTLIELSLPLLTQHAQVVHITGTHFPHIAKRPNYETYQFVTKDLPELLRVADVVVTRSGMSFISELAVLRKAVITIPMPHSHQDKNAVYLENNTAALVLRFDYTLTPEDVDQFSKAILNMLSDDQNRAIYSSHIGNLINPAAASNLAKEVESLIA